MSETDTCLSDTGKKIAREIYRALETLGAEPDLLAIIGSWGDTLDDGEILDIIKSWNETGRAMTLLKERH